MSELKKKCRVKRNKNVENLFEDENLDESSINEEQEEMPAPHDEPSDTEESFLNKRITVYDGIKDGVYLATIKKISKAGNGKLQMKFVVRVRGLEYPIYAWLPKHAVKGNALYRLITCFINPVNTLGELLNRDVYISVKNNSHEGRNYENIIDFKDESICYIGDVVIDKYGRFI